MDSEPVIVPGIVLSDQSIQDRRTGKYTLVGIFDNLNFRSLPSISQTFWATCWISNLHGGVGEIEGACRLLHKESGRVLEERFIPIDLNRNMERDVWFTIVEKFHKTTFYEPGKHEIVISLNGEEIGRRSFNVRLR